jgi:hypothetical protein
MSSLPPVQPTTSPTPPDAGAEKSGFSSSEFATSVGVVVANMIGIAAVVWKLAPEQTEQLNHAATAIIGAASVMVANALIVWRFIEARRSVKTASINAEAAIQNVRTLAAAPAGSNSPAQEQAILSTIAALHNRK